ncbi:MAG: IMP cyclohydrolase [Planctomycetota bacterium]
MDVQERAAANVQALSENPYPGRGIVIGVTPDEAHFVQLYWIMGRSENSRNRVFVREGDVVRTAPWDESKVEDPALIIYHCTNSFGRCHVVSNGDQTDTVSDAMRAGRTFEDALFTRSFEPDAPNFTPRIAGVVNLEDPFHAYKLAIVKAVRNNAGYCVRHVFNYETPIPGVGHCVTTYRDDGDPLPAFRGEPYMLELTDEIDQLAERYWQALNEDNKVALLAKFIDLDTGQTEHQIINKHE